MLRKKDDYSDDPEGAIGEESPDSTEQGGRCKSIRVTAS